MNVSVDESHQSPTHCPLHFSDVCIFYIEHTALTDLLSVGGSDEDQPRQCQSVLTPRRLYTDPHGHHQPVNYRIYDKTEHKTKNDYFQEMLAEVLAWGLEPAFVTGDSWYSSLENLVVSLNFRDRHTPF